jgi:hypothetical protein
MIDENVFVGLEDETEDLAESTVKTCGHPGCACLMQEEEVFCSDECEQAGESATECPCGHRACTDDTSGVHHH